MINEIIPDIRNKLQASFLVFELLAEGKNIPERFVKLAKSDLVLVEELIQKIELAK